VVDDCDLTAARRRARRAHSAPLTGGLGHPDFESVLTGFPSGMQKEISDRETIKIRQPSDA
jgi:hypothetical protein